MVDKIAEPFDQLPMFPCWRVKKTGEVYPSFQAAMGVHQLLTFNCGYKAIRRPNPEEEPMHQIYAKTIEAGFLTQPTLFEEIEVTMKQASPKVEALYDKVFNQAEIDANYLAGWGVDALKNFIESQWDPSKCHIVMHSSGYDSRLIGAIIKKLAVENGMDWLGEVRFVCFEPEIGYFKRIMDYMEWPERFVYPIRPKSKCHDYYADVTDLDFVGKVYCEPGRFWAGPALARLVMKEDGFNEDDCVGITALFSDETMKANRLQWDAVSYFMACYLFESPSPLIGSDVPFMAPFVSRLWVDLLTKYRVPVSINDFKLEMLKIVDPTLLDLASFPNYRFVEGPFMTHKKHGPYQLLSEETTKRMQDSFLDSWYCRAFMKEDIEFEPILRYFSPTVSEYITAAICEGFITQGGKIRGV